MSAVQASLRCSCGQWMSSDAAGHRCPPVQPIAERFWSKVERRTQDECWPWLGYRMANGYGQVRHNGAARLAHRVSYELATGIDPADLDVCHHCDNPPCVNPHHLFIGTHTQNMQDMVVRGRARGRMSGMTHCMRGHLFDEENTYVSPDGRRACRECFRSGYPSRVGGRTRNRGGSA